MVSKLILFLILLISAISCGPKKAESLSVKLNVFKSNITAAAALNGGVVIVGRSEDGLDAFRVGLMDVNQDLSLNLKKGKWEFAAIAWEGNNGPVTGKNRCAYTGFVELKDAEASISLNLNMLRCASDFNGMQFSHADYRKSATGEFYDFFPVMCMNPILNNANCSYYAPNSTNFLSYKIVFPADKKGEVQAPNSSLSTNCLPMNTTPRAKIPVTDTSTDGPFGVKTIFFMSSDCSGAPVVYDFEDGLRDNLSVPVLNATDFSVGYYSFLYLNPGAAFDMRPIEPQYFTLMNGAYEGGVTYFNSTSISYMLSELPAGVQQMCLTTSASCLASEWLAPPTANGNISILSGDGTKTVKLFYQTANGVVSTTPYEKTFVLDTIAPQSFLINMSLSTATVAAGVNVAWNPGIEDNFKSALVRVCLDQGCSGTVLGTSTQTAQGVTNVQFNAGELSPALTLGQSVYFHVKIEDKAGNFQNFVSSSKTVGP